MGKNLPVYGVEGNLKEFETSKDETAKGIQNLPSRQQRLMDEDVYEDQDQASAKITRKVSARPEENDSMFLNEATKTMLAPKGRESVTLADFEIKSVIGRGTFGKVFLVQLKNDRSEVFAMKSLGKHTLFRRSWSPLVKHSS